MGILFLLRGINWHHQCLNLGRGLGSRKWLDLPTWYTFAFGPWVKKWFEVTLPEWQCFMMLDAFFCPLSINSFLKMVKLNFGFYFFSRFILWLLCRLSIINGITILPCYFIYYLSLLDLQVSTFADMEGEETFDPSLLGSADEVVEERISDDDVILIKGTKTNSAVSDFS